MIDSVIHAFEIFWTVDIVLKDTLVMETPDLRPIPLCEPIDTTGEQLVDHLAARVKHVVLGDWFWRKNLDFKGG